LSSARSHPAATLITSSLPVANHHALRPVLLVHLHRQSAESKSHQYAIFFTACPSTGPTHHRTRSTRASSSRITRRSSPPPSSTPSNSLGAFRQVQSFTSNCPTTDRAAPRRWITYTDHKLRVVNYPNAGMVELADTLALGASAARHAGSSPVPGTKFYFFSSSSLFAISPPVCFKDGWEDNLAAR
jgi:hypothetical protein